MSSHQLNSKNNGLAFLLKTILRHCKCFLSFVVTDGKDGNGLKLVLMLRFQKSPEKFLWLALPDKIHLISSS